MRKADQPLDAYCLTRDRLAKDRKANGHFAEGNKQSKKGSRRKIGDRPSLRDQIDVILAAHEQQTGTSLIKTAIDKNPLEVLKIRAQLEPKDLKVDHVITQVVLVCHPQEPPDGWKPPDLSAMNDPEVQQAIDAEVIEEATKDDQ